MNCQPMVAQAQTMPTTFAVDRVRERKIDRSTSGSSRRFWTATKAMSSRTDTTRLTTVVAEPQPTSGARVSAKTSSRTPPVAVSAPRASKPGRRPSTCSSGAMTLRTVSRTSAATTNGTKKVSRQLSEVSSPEKTRPAA